MRRAMAISEHLVLKEACPLHRGLALAWNEMQTQGVPTGFKVYGNCPGQPIVHLLWGLSLPQTVGVAFGGGRVEKRSLLATLACEK
mgnify:CR=1 FL=1